MTSKIILMQIIRHKGKCDFCSILPCRLCPIPNTYDPKQHVCNVHSRNERYKMAIDLFVQAYGKSELMGELL